MKQAATRALHAYWDGLRAGRAAPERRDIEPGAIRSLLGDVFLLEGGAGSGHAVRLAGTRICTLLGREWKGRPFTEPFAQQEWTDVQSLLDGVSSTAVPAAAGITGETSDGRRLNLELLVLPLRHRGRTHSRILGSLVAEEWPYWAGLVPLSRLSLLSLRHLRDVPQPVEFDLMAPLPARAPLGRLTLITGGRS